MEEPITQGSTKRIAVVTGANKGIGLEICTQLASHGVTVVLTARDEGRGIESFEKLKNSGVSHILFHQLDVADPSSVASLANFIKTGFGKLDILVNNAGVAGVTTKNQTLPSSKEERSDLMEQEHGYIRFRKLLEESLETREAAEECLNINYYGMKRVTEALIPSLLRAKSPRVVNVSSHYGLLSEEGLPRSKKIRELARETHEKAEECLKVNYYGVKRVTEALIPLLKLSKSPRIVNVSSRYGQLRNIPGEVIRKEMGAIDDQTEERLDELLKSFLNDFKEGKLEANGWPTSASAYIVSKVALNTYTRILAKIYPTFCINCVTPGFVKTDINFNTGIFTVEDGAKGPVMLALLPDGSSSGLFYQQMDLSTFE